MSRHFERTRAAMAFAAENLDEHVRLETLSGRADLSPFHLHRVFSAVAGETPKEYTTRLRLDRAASMLLTTRSSVLRVALECGFESHEGFTRAFKRRFETTPSAYRARGFATATTEAQAGAHRECIEHVGPCLGLYRYRESAKPKGSIMSYSITKKSVSAQPVLVQTKKASGAAEISQAIGEALGAVFAYAQKNGIAVTGRPFARYLNVGPGSMTLEPGMCIASSDDASVEATDGADGGVRVDTQPGGMIVTTMHVGPYDKLGEAHSAVEKWIEAEGLTPNGAPWETYITDPTEVEDPAEWQTEVCWPVR